MTHRQSKAFVVLTHTYMPITKGSNRGRIQVHEACYFIKNIKTKHLQEASVIMDVTKRILIKNAAKEKGADYDDIEAHVIKGYADKYKRFLELTGAEIPEALLLNKKEVEAKLEKLAKKEGK